MHSRLLLFYLPSLTLSQYFFHLVQVLGIYSLFPTLVASTASIFNCTDAINGKRYLVADLTVTCYEVWHLVYVAGASVSVIVYCIGVPIFLASILILDTCQTTAPRGCKSVKRNAAVHSDAMIRTDEEEDVVPACYKVCPKVKCVCARRSSTPWGFRTASFRERFGLLISGTFSQASSNEYSRIHLTFTSCVSLLEYRL